MYKTSVIRQAAFLLTRGHKLSGTHVDAQGFVTMVFPDLDEREAGRFLKSPEFETCEAFSRAYRSVKREIDIAKGVVWR